MLSALRVSTKESWRCVRATAGMKSPGTGTVSSVLSVASYSSTSSTSTPRGTRPSVAADITPRHSDRDATRATKYDLCLYTVQTVRV